MKYKSLSILMVFAAFGCVNGRLQTPAFGSDWYRWRGPEQNGVSREKNLPEKWDPDGKNGPKPLWEVPVGGMSSPVVMKGKVYSLTRRGEVPMGDGDNATLIAGKQTQESLICLDAETGRELWEYRESITQSEVPFHRLGWSNVAADPGSGHVYALLCHCSLICLDGQTGKLLWKRQMTEEFGMISTFGGRTPSPAVDEDQVFIAGVAFGWGDNARAQYRVFAFNKENGELNWTNGTGGLPVDSPYQTPTITVINGEKQLVIGSGDGGVYGFQPRTGRKLWDYKISKRGVNASVLVEGSRVFICTGEVNFDNAANGTVRCIDVGTGKAVEIWRRDGIEAGFSTPTLFDGRLYVCDNSATLFAMDAATGADHWKKRCGTIGKASVVYADGKIYLPEANGKMWILKPGDKSCAVLSKVEMEEKLGREYVMFGSVAIANGRVYLQSANRMFCIGEKAPKVAEDPIPAAPQEAPLNAAAAKVAWIQVRPADVAMKPGEKVKLSALAYDDKGRLIGPVKEGEWKIGQVAIPPPPTAPAGMPPTAAGNLKGTVTNDGEYTAAAGPPQGGAVAVTAGGVTGFTRIRVFPPLPWRFDFEQVPLDAPPLTWLGAGGKFSVKQIDNTKALCKVPLMDLYYRARTNFGTPDMSNYTIQADARSGLKVMGGQRQIPDPGVINQRYVLMLYGNHQRVQIHTWAGALPTELSGAGALNKTAPFKWDPEKWYTLKLRVDQLPDKAIARGKVWPTGDKEPDAWTIEMEDPLPSRMGNPGLFGHSLVTPYKSEIYYDNILVTGN